MSIISIITGTPLWVWGILIMLIILGIKARHTRVVPLSQMFALPIIFLAWSLSSLFKKCSIVPTTIISWHVGLLGGVICGMYIALNIPSQKTDHGIKLPGSWNMLVLSLTAFAIKYCLGVMHAIIPHAFQQPLFYLGESILLGLITGTFWGRLLGLWYKHYR